MKKFLCLMVVAAALTGCLLENGQVVDETTDAGVDAPSPNKCTVTVQATDSSASESGDTATVEFERSNCAFDQQLEVKFDLDDGSTASSDDYVAWDGWYVLILAGESKATRVVNPRNDTTVEGPETLIFTIRAEPHLIVGAPATATVTINDNDVAPGQPNHTVTADQSSVSAGQCTNVRLDIISDITSCVAIGGMSGDGWAGVTATVDTVRQVCPTGTSVSYGWRCTGPGGTRDQSTTINVIQSTDHTPVARDDAAVTQVNTAVTVAVLANDTGLEDGNITVTVTNPVRGSATVTSSNTVIYTPDNGLSGADSFQYTVHDADGDVATANVTVNVTVPNQPLPCSNLQMTLDNQAEVNQMNSAGTQIMGWPINGPSIFSTAPTLSTVSIPNGGCAATAPKGDGTNHTQGTCSGTFFPNDPMPRIRWRSSFCPRLKGHVGQADQAGCTFDGDCERDPSGARLVTCLSWPSAPCWAGEISSTVKIADTTPFTVLSEMAFGWREIAFIKEVQIQQFNELMKRVMRRWGIKG